MKRHLLIALSSLATLSLSAISAIAAPPNPTGCPEGWVPRPPELNPALGRCMPGTIAPNSGGSIQKKQLPDASIVLPEDVPLKDRVSPVKTDAPPMLNGSDTVILHHR